MVYDWIRKHIAAKYRCVTARVLLVLFLVPSLIGEAVIALPQWLKEISQAYKNAWDAAKDLKDQ